MAAKTVIITGASSGIGLGLARFFIHEGYSVVANSRNISKAGLDLLTTQVRYVDGDVADPRTGEALVKKALDWTGRVDLVVNNAGAFLSKPFEDYSAADLQAFVDTNLTGFLNVTQPAVRAMKKQGSGHIVTITTTLVDQPVGYVPAAVPIMTKGGLNAVTKALALELAKSGIRVNCVGAGIIDTPMHAPENHGFLKTLHPLDRVGTVNEVVDAVAYLESAGFVTGENLHVDGGAHAGKW